MKYSRTNRVTRVQEVHVELGDEVFMFDEDRVTEIMFDHEDNITSNVLYHADMMGENKQFRKLYLCGTKGEGGQLDVFISEEYEYHKEEVFPYEVKTWTYCDIKYEVTDVWIDHVTTDFGNVSKKEA